MGLRKWLRGARGVPARPPQCWTGEGARLSNGYFKYFPNINFSFSLVAAGIFDGSVRMAFAIARQHMHTHAFAIADNVTFPTFASFSAFTNNKDPISYYHATSSHC